ncbi:MAG: 2-oxoglutarate dehydrogenase complex dihydrolipoyllysine-residue succinyltransferase [Alphaproteobacteria bacterium]|nr:2-oxoglutarate dehydrogenase complex dihydrolipoyllysine-residue succinyltransferase [Alphaproteobacteria bacterium]
MTDITVPVLGESVKEATVGSWLKKPGEHVDRDEPLVELETDKVSVEVSATEAGVLSEILAKEGDTVQIGALLGRIGANGASAPAPQSRASEPKTKPSASATPAAADTGSGKTMDIKVPAMGESVTEGTLANWLVKPGQQVAQDDPIAEIETDKVAIEVPAPAAGVISDQLVKEGETVSIGTIIARMNAGASGAKPAASAAPAASTPAPAAKANGPVSEKATDKVAPSVQRIATEAGVAASQIPGTGRGGRATKGDALKYVAETASAPASQASRPAPAVEARAPRELGPREERQKMTRLRQTIARRLKEAQNTAAMLTTFNDVDMSVVMELRKKYKDSFEKKHGVKLGFMGFFTKACVAALKEIPNVNAEIDGADIIYKNFYNIGVAVGTDKGLVVPVVRDADVMSLAEIEAEIGRLGGLARDGGLGLDDLQGGTFTITNGGVYGSLMSTPILNPPQSGVLGMHRIENRPVAIASKVEIRPMMYLALSYDHRIVDGKEAVTFLVRVKEALEDPERLLLDI